MNHRSDSPRCVLFRRSVLPRCHGILRIRPFTMKLTTGVPSCSSQVCSSLISIFGCIRPSEKGMRLRSSHYITRTASRVLLGFLCLLQGQLSVAPVCLSVPLTIPIMILRSSQYLVSHGPSSLSETFSVVHAYHAGNESVAKASVLPRPASPVILLPFSHRNLSMCDG